MVVVGRKRKILKLEEKMILLVVGKRATFECSVEINERWWRSI